MQSGTIRQFFKDVGLDFDKMRPNEPLPVKGWEVQTITPEGKLIWKKVKNAVRKRPAPHIVLRTKDFQLDCSPDHRVLVESTATGMQAYVEVGTVKVTAAEYRVMTVNGWQSFTVESLPGELEIADIEVEGTNSYISNGILSHNTLYGDPTTTPGGRAIPYACSLRLVLGEPRQLKKLINGTEQVYGVLVYCKTIKNKVARPWRKIEFEIHFGKGLVEDEQLMTELIQYCKKGGKPIAPDGCWVEFSEGGSWKYFKVTDPDGVLIHDVSFHREEFKEKIITQKQFWPYIRAAMDATFIIKPEEKDHASLSGYDPNSFLEAMAKEMEVTPQPEVL